MPKFRCYKKKPSRKPNKTTFAKKKAGKKTTKTPEKGAAGVKCFGCQQIGHYANRCPNKTIAKAVKFIEEEFNLIVFSDYESDDNMSLYEIDSDYEYRSEEETTDSDYEDSESISSNFDYE
ncbi:hypothetical protein ACLOJK_018878 [Asimina triloba]